MEINELYKMALTVLLMDVPDTARSAVSGKPDEQAPLAFALCIKFVCSQENSQPLVPAGERLSLIYPLPLNFFSLCLWRPLISAAKATRGDGTSMCVQTLEIIFFRKHLRIANT